MKQNFEAMFTAEVDRVLDIKKPLVVGTKGGVYFGALREVMVVSNNNTDNRIIGFSIHTSVDFKNQSIDDLYLINPTGLGTVGKVKELVSCDPC